MYRTIGLVGEEKALQLRWSGKKGDLAGLFQLLLFSSFLERFGGFLSCILFCVSGFGHNLSSLCAGRDCEILPELFFMVSYEVL